MKIKTWILYAGLLVSISAHAAGGANTGNGGGAWVCRNQDGSIRWAKLIDLIEAVPELNLVLESPLATIDDELNRVDLKVHTLPIGFSKSFDAELAGVRARKVSIRSAEIALVPVGDANLALAPKASSCSGGHVGFEQAANYLPEHLLVDPEIEGAFSPMDQSALLVHETVYSLYRKMLWATNSDAARKLTGLLFADSKATTDFSSNIYAQALVNVFQIPGSYGRFVDDNTYFGLSIQWAGYFKVYTTIWKKKAGQDWKKVNSDDDWKAGGDDVFLVASGYVYDEQSGLFCSGSTHCATGMRLNPSDPSELQIVSDPKHLRYDSANLRGAASGTVLLAFRRR